MNLNALLLYRIVISIVRLRRQMGPVIIEEIGYAKHEIKTLKPFVANEIYLKTLKYENICTICLENFELKQSLIELKCLGKHVYH